MVWQRSGTVSVQNGSTTVTGVNVDFAASSRNGDSFIGPDGATYEVINVASATVISILPAYKGPTVSGAAYAVMPVQGYDKMLSDAFNSLVNQFGTKLASLGTTGNYDILPVTKGGTGGNDKASARVGLGLGAVAVEDVLPLIKGGTGASSQSGARTALGLGSSAVAALVGTVSQSAGVATGAIVERGSNGNGEYTKYADGTLECWGSKTPTLTTSTAIGQGFQSAAVTRYDFPAAFVGDANSVIVLPQVTYISGSSQPWCTVSGKAANYANIIALGFHAGIEVRTGYFAIGRWY
jgi:hypothetical protein